MNFCCSQFAWGIVYKALRTNCTEVWQIFIIFFTGRWLSLFFFAPRMHRQLCQHCCITSWLGNSPKYSWSGASVLPCQAPRHLSSLLSVCNEQTLYVFIELIPLSSVHFNSLPWKGASNPIWQEKMSSLKKMLTMMWIEEHMRHSVLVSVRSAWIVFISVRIIRIF